MNRREFLAATAGVISGAVIPPAQASKVDPHMPAVHTRRNLRMVCDYPPGPAGTADTAFALSKRLEHLLGEDYRIELISGHTGSIAAFRDGTADITFASETANAACLPALAATTGLPGRFALSPESARIWLTATGGNLWHRMHRLTGLQPLYAGPEGATPTLWSSQPLQSFSGLIVASAAPLRGEVFKGLGAELVPLAPADFAEALANGTIDAVETATVADAMALGVVRVARHALEGAAGAHSGSRALTFRPSLWQTFTPRAQAAVTKLAQIFPDQMYSQIAANEPALKTVLQSAFRINFAHAGDQIQTAVDRLSEAIIADFQSRHGQSAALPWHCPPLSGKQIATQRIT